MTRSSQRHIARRVRVKKVAGMQMRGQAIVVYLLFLSVTLTASATQTKKEPIKWHRSPGNILEQDPQWYGSDEAIRIAENVLLYQRHSGGWPANIDMIQRLTEQDKAKVRKRKNRQDSTLDNGTTHTHLRYLAKVYNATELERFKEFFLKGIDYLLEAQHANGGWPQTYPWLRGYHRFITFNDGAMVGAIGLLHDIAEHKPDYAPVDGPRRRKAKAAVRKGTDCILKCQIVVNGKRTAWCQQHDDTTLEPRPARSFEPVAITACESVGVVEFLMNINNPQPEIVQAVQSAVAWLNRVKLTGIRQARKPDEATDRGFDVIVVKDTKARPIWARFYELDTNRPIFGDKNGKVYYAMSEISTERRTGYAWYGYWPADLLTHDYPDWLAKLPSEENALKN